VAEQPTLIIQVPRDSAIERQLRAEPPPAIAGEDVLVQTGPTDEEGNLEELAGEIVMSVPSPQELARRSDDVERVLRGAGGGAAPLVVVVEAAEELQEDEAAPVVAAARRARRPVILRVVRPSER
jgi:hypothetical protein